MWSPTGKARGTHFTPQWGDISRLTSGRIHPWPKAMAFCCRGKRRDFIAKLKKLGFESPEPGGRHFYMRHRTFTLTLPNNAEYSIPQIKMFLKKIELGIKKKISLKEWQKL